MGEGERVELFKLKTKNDNYKLRLVVEYTVYRK